MRISDPGTVAINAGAVAGVAGLAVATGTMDSTNTALVVMGFDPDRAQLISSLLIGGAAAGAATLITTRTRQAALMGLIGFAALFGPTFVAETDNALTATGAAGSFDATGWLLTLLTLATTGFIAAWAGTTLSAAIRPALVDAATAVRETLGSRRANGKQMTRPLGVALVLILLFVTIPVFGDMVNYTPDSRMLHGDGQAQSGGNGSTPIDSPNSSGGQLSNGSGGPGDRSPAPSGAGGDPTGRPSARRPWLAWKPNGAGAVTAHLLPAPWKRGSAATDDIAIYTPPGYDPHGSRRYPVLYEAPTPFTAWDSATNVKVALDALIDAGSMPAMIAVFIDSGSAPYPDSECANSVDGRMWMDTFIGETVVAYVDSHYLTIASAGARAITGMSQGGYCAAIVALRHPSVFGTSIPISGYYQAGSAGGNSAAPFGKNATALGAASPMVVATQVTPRVRASLFFIVVADPTQHFFGSQAVGFERLLASHGFKYVAQNSTLPHGWTQVRQEFPIALETWAEHLASTGIV